MDLVIGAGAVGTAIAAFLIKAGGDVLFYTRADQSDAFDQKRLTANLTYVHKQIRCIAPERVTRIDISGIDHIYIAVKHRTLGDIFNLLPEYIDPSLQLIPCMNGVRIREKFLSRYPKATINPMTVMFNAHLVAPMEVNITTKAGLLIQQPDPNIIQTFKRVGVPIHQGSEPKEWGKLLINLNNSICALTHRTFIDAFTDPHLRRIAAAMLMESRHVLNQAKVPYQLPVSIPVPVSIYQFMMTRSRILPLIASSVLDYSGTYPSMMDDIEHHRETEVDQINGEILMLAQQLGLSAPINQHIVQLIKRLEQQNPKQYLSPEMLAALVL